MRDHAKGIALLIAVLVGVLLLLHYRSAFGF